MRGLILIVALLAAIITGGLFASYQFHEGRAKRVPDSFVVSDCDALLRESVTIQNDPDDALRAASQATACYLSLTAPRGNPEKTTNGGL